MCFIEKIRLPILLYCTHEIQRENTSQNLKSKCSETFFHFENEWLFEVHWKWFGIYLGGDVVVCNCQESIHFESQHTHYLPLTHWNVCAQALLVECNAFSRSRLSSLSVYRFPDFPYQIRWNSVYQIQRHVCRLRSSQSCHLDCGSRMRRNYSVWLVLHIWLFIVQHSLGFSLALVLVNSISRQKIIVKLQF